MSLIKAENIWALWGIITGWAATSIFLEQKYAWAKKISGSIIALLGALVLSNLNVIPKESVVYDTVWDYVVPLTVPLMLFNTDIKSIWKNSGKLGILFLISSVGTMVGAVCAHFLLRAITPETAAVAATMTGSYTGGVQNFAAMASMSNLSGELTSALVVADNLLMAILFFVLMALPNLSFFQKVFRHPYVDEVSGDQTTNASTSATYWGKKEISLRDIAFSVATATVIVAVSVGIGSILNSIIPQATTWGQLLGTILGNQYLLITTITIIVLHIFPHYCATLAGAQEIGFFLIYLFLVVIGVPASVSSIITQAPVLLLYCFIILAVNLLITLVAGKVFNFSIEEVTVAVNANAGGAATAMAFTISKGWKKLIVPSMLVGVLGYVVGNYCGTIVWILLS